MLFLNAGTGSVSASGRKSTVSETKSIMVNIIKGWSKEVVKTYKEEPMGDKKRGKQKDVKDETDYQLTATVLVRILIICHVVFCVQGQPPGWGGHGKGKG